MRLLFVEDDLKITEYILKGLKEAGVETMLIELLMTGLMYEEGPCLLVEVIPFTVLRYYNVVAE